MTYNTNWCGHARHSRPATTEERAEDTRRRVEALEAAERDGRMSARRVEEHWRALDGFEGYRRCTIPDRTIGASNAD